MTFGLNLFVNNFILQAVQSVCLIIGTRIKTLITVRAKLTFLVAAIEKEHKISVVLFKHCIRSALAFSLLHVLSHNW